MGKMRQRRKKIKFIINKILKLFSFAIILVLISFIIFFVYYFASLKVYEMNPTTKLPKFGLYTIISPSMEPNVSVYDVVVDLNLYEKNEIKVGDIITFISNSNISRGLTVTHRVVKVIQNEDGTESYITKGDNNTKPDDATVNQKDILGKVLFKIPQLGRVQFLLANKFGWIIAILLPALGVIINDFIKGFKLLTFNSKFMRFSTINKKIETEINVDDLNLLKSGLSTAKKYYKSHDNIE